MNEESLANDLIGLLIMLIGAVGALTIMEVILDVFHRR